MSTRAFLADEAEHSAMVAQVRADLGAVAEALRKARHHVYRAQHDGKHEQDRHDARQWMDDHWDGRCRCDRCERDEARFQAAVAKHG